MVLSTTGPGTFPKVLYKLVLAGNFEASLLNTYFIHILWLVYILCDTWICKSVLCLLNENYQNSIISVILGLLDSYGVRYCLENDMEMVWIKVRENLYFLVKMIFVPQCAHKDKN